MPRPQQNNADYFSHDNDMRNHRKVKILRNKFGQVLGYAFWAIILEYLTGMDGTEFEYSDMEFEIIAAEVGEVSAAEIKNIVDYALKIELLFKTSDNFIYSESLNQRLMPVFEKRRRERQKSSARLRRLDGKFIDDNIDKTPEKTTSDGVSAAEIPQSKVKKRKVNITVSLDTVVGLPTATTTPAKSFEERCRLFIEAFNSVKKSKYQVTEKVRTKLKARLANYNSKQIMTALKNAMVDPHHRENNFTFVTPEFILREDIIERYLNTTPEALKMKNNIPVSYSQPVTINHDDML